MVRSPTLTKGIAGVSSNGSRPDSRRRGSIAGTTRGLCGATAAAIAAIWSGVVPQQPPTMLTRPALGEFADQPRHVFRALVVLAEFVGQAGVRIGANQRVGDAADIGDMGAQIFGAERAVEADGDRLGVPHRIPERFRQLARQQAAGFVGDGARDHHGHVDAALLGDFGDRVERRLGVQRVEDGFDQQQIGAAVEQAVDLLAIGLAQIVEGDGAIAGIGDVGRDRGGAVGRAERAGDEARLAVLGADALGGGARELRAVAVELIGEVRHVVVGLRDRGRGERVGRDDVGAGAQVIGVDVLDRLAAASGSAGRCCRGRRGGNPQSARRETRPRHIAGPGSWCPWRRRAPGCVRGRPRAGRFAWAKRARSSDQAAFCAPLGRMPSRWLIANTRSARFMV